MSSGIVDQITLECLMNKDLYHKLVTNKKNAQDKKMDYKLYRKRILSLTKELIANEVQTDLMQDVEYAFNNYVKTCIRHFKITDECEEIQRSRSTQEGNPSEENKEDEKNGDDDEIIEPVGEQKESDRKVDTNKDAMMFKSIKFPNGTLNGFVNSNSTNY
jgi:hypothetical protein